nr:hypothetical protein Iba_chr10eCG10460 [Ipomoea batatas]
MTNGLTPPTGDDSDGVHQEKRAAAWLEAAHDDDLQWWAMSMAAPATLSLVTAVEAAGSDGDPSSPSGVCNEHSAAAVVQCSSGKGGDAMAASLASLPVVGGGRIPLLGVLVVAVGGSLVDDGIGWFASVVGHCASVVGLYASVVVTLV